MPRLGHAHYGLRTHRGAGGRARVCGSSCVWTSPRSRAAPIRGTRWAFAREVTIRTSSPSTPTLRYQAGQRTAEQTVLLPFSAGSVTDYPTDRYATELELAAEYNGEPAALRLEFA